MTLKCGRSARNILHFMMAQEIASSSSSMMAYRDSASVRKRDPAWMRVIVCLLLQDESKAVPAGIGAQLCWLIGIKE